MVPWSSLLSRKNSKGARRWKDEKPKLMQLGKRPALKLSETVVLMICKCFDVDTGWQVQAAIDADDKKQLVKLLQDFQGTHASLSFDCLLSP